MSLTFKYQWSYTQLSLYFAHLTQQELSVKRVFRNFSLLPISSGFCLVWSTENRLRKASDCRRGKLDGKSQGGIVTCRRIVCLSSCLSPCLLQPLFSSPRFALHVHLLGIASISSLGVFVVMFMQVYCLCWLLMCDCLADASVLNSRIVTQLC